MVTRSFERVSFVCMPDMKSLSLTVQKLWPRLKFLPRSHSQDKNRCPWIPFQGHKNYCMDQMSCHKYCTWNMKNLPLMVNKLWPKLRFCLRTTTTTATLGLWQEFSRLVSQRTNNETTNTRKLRLNLIDLIEQWCFQSTRQKSAITLIKAVFHAFIQNDFSKKIT